MAENQPRHSLPFESRQTIIRDRRNTHQHSQSTNAVDPNDNPQRLLDRVRYDNEAPSYITPGLHDHEYATVYTCAHCAQVVLGIDRERHMHACYALASRSDYDSQSEGRPAEIQPSYRPARDTYRCQTCGRIIDGGQGHWEAHRRICFRPQRPYDHDPGAAASSSNRALSETSYVQSPVVSSMHDDARQLPLQVVQQDVSNPYVGGQPATRSHPSHRSSSRYPSHYSGSHLSQPSGSHHSSHYSGDQSVSSAIPSSGHMRHHQRLALTDPSVSSGQSSSHGAQSVPGSTGQRSQGDWNIPIDYDLARVERMRVYTSSLSSGYDPSQGSPTPSSAQSYPYSSDQSSQR